MPWDEWEVCCVCVFILYPSPCIYRREPWLCSSSTSVNRHWEPMKSCHIEGLRRWAYWAVGRQGWSSDHPVAPTAPNYLGWAVLGLPLSEHRGMDCPNSVWVGLWTTLGPFEHESALWYFLWFFVGPKCACNLHTSLKTYLTYSKR